jgi:hypothetical protein
LIPTTQVELDEMATLCEDKREAYIGFVADESKKVIFS